jgi:hypothetical protein
MAMIEGLRQVSTFTQSAHGRRPCSAGSAMPAGDHRDLPASSPQLSRLFCILATCPVAGTYAYGFEMDWLGPWQCVTAPLLFCFPGFDADPAGDR